MLRDPDRVLALNYAGAMRPALGALWALDEALGRIVASTTQPLIGQMRLTWWHDRLCALDRGEPPAERVLAALRADVMPRDVSGKALAELVEGWEAVLEPPLTDADLDVHASKRGSHLFVISAGLLGGDPGGAAGHCWALADFARYCAGRAATRDIGARALALADPPIMERGMAKPLRMLAWLASYDVLHGVEIVRPRWTMLRAALA